MPNTYTSARPMTYPEFSGLGDITSKVLIYKDTPVYDLAKNTVLATLPSGRAVDMVGPSLLGFAIVIYASPLKTGRVKVSDVVIETDTQRMAIQATVNTDVRGGTSKDFSLVMTLPKDAQAVALQFANNWYRISARQWVNSTDVKATGGSEPKKIAKKFPWLTVGIIGGALALVGTGFGMFKAGRRRARR